MTASNKTFRFIIVTSLLFIVLFVTWISKYDGANVLTTFNLLKKRRSITVLPKKPEIYNIYNIGILIIIDKNDTSNFKVAKDSLTCYANLQNYTLEYVYVDENENLTKMCPQKDFFLKRHCIAVHYIKKYDWTLFLDSDIGVINPHHRIEEYIDESVHLIFYDRFYNWEVTAGSYLAKNSDYTSYFLKEWANFDFRLPNSFHGTDNGLLHMVLIEQLAPSASAERAHCERLLNDSKDYDGLFLFEACTRMIVGLNTTWPGKVKIIQKGKAWSRDGWITSTKYCVNDFMFHGWKQSKLGGEWSMPFADPNALAECDSGYAAFATSPGFNLSIKVIEGLMGKKYAEVDKKFRHTVSRVGKMSG